QHRAGISDRDPPERPSLRALLHALNHLSGGHVAARAKPPALRFSLQQKFDVRSAHVDRKDPIGLLDHAGGATYMTRCGRSSVKTLPLQNSFPTLQSYTKSANVTCGLEIAESGASASASRGMVAATPLPSLVVTVAPGRLRFTPSLAAKRRSMAMPGRPVSMTHMPLCPLPKSNFANG